MEYKEFINETSLSRVFRHYQNKEIPVATLTAFRDGNSYAENVKRNKSLAIDIRNAGYGYVYVDGGWIEDTDQGSKKVVQEDSILIFGNVGDNGKLKGLVRKWIKQWNQDAALFKEAGTNAIILILQDGSEDNLSNKFTRKQLEVGYTRIRGRGKSKGNGRVFAFESERDKLFKGAYSDRLIGK